MKKTSMLTRMLALALCLLLLIPGCKGPDPDNSPTDTAQPGPTDTQPATVTYTVTVVSEAGSGIPDLGVYVYEDEAMTELQAFQRTDETGAMQFEGIEGLIYTAVLKDVPSGYMVEDSYAVTGTDTVITLAVDKESDVPLSELNYKLGDTVYNFALTDGAGNEYTLYGLLAEKYAVVLNFWFTKCGPCRNEFPYLQAAWEEYGDSVAVLCLNPTGEDAAAVEQFAAELGLTMPVMACDPAWATAMNVNAYPTTVVIDRFGTICMVHTGAVTDAGVFEGVFAHFGAEVYEQRLITDINELAVEMGPGDEDPMADNPTEVGGSSKFDITVTPGGQWTFDLYKAGGMILQIKDSTAAVEYDGKTYRPESGTVTVWLKDMDPTEAASITIRNNGDEVRTYTVNLYIPAGDMGNPYSLKPGDLTTNLAAGNDQGVFYIYTAAEDGELSVRLVSITAGVECGYTLYNLTSMAYRTMEADGQDNVLTVSVKKGDRVQMSVCAVPDSAFNYPAATVQSAVSFTAGEAGSDEPVEPEKLTYTVTVLDDKGAPVTGVYLSVAGLEEPLVTSTDAAGKITFRAPAGTYPVTLTVPEGYTAEQTAFEVSDTACDLTVTVSEIVIVMHDYTVTVTDHTGAPLAGVTVVVGDSMAVTDAAGKAVFRLEEGEYTASVSLPAGYVSEKGTDLAFAAGSTELAVTLTGKADYSVTVVDQSGKPMTGVAVTIGSASGVTDAAGKFTANLKQDSYPVQITVPGGYVSEKGATFTVGKDAAQLTVTLTKMVSYSVTVTDQDGKAMAGVAVSIGSATGKTDAQGKFAANLKWGNYTAALVVPAKYTASATSFSLTGEQPAVSVKLEKIIEMADYTVTVVDQSGKAMAGVAVSIGSAAGKTDGQGKFTAKLEKGSYTATVVLPADYTSAAGTSFAFSGTSTELTVTLTEVIEKVNYTVTVADQDGKAMAGVAVTIGSASGKTDALGKFTATLDEGSYTASVTLPEKYTASATRFTLTAAAPSAEVTLTRIIEKIDYSVTVVDQDGKAMSGVSVTIGSASGKTNAAGKFTATLDEGSYTASVTVPGGYTAAGETAFTLTTEAPAVSVSLTKVIVMVDYSVTVVDQDGKPMAGVTAAIGSSSGKTDGQGKFTARLEKGSYTATVVVPEDYASDKGARFTLTGDAPAVSVTLTSTAPATKTYTVTVTDYFGVGKANVAVRFLQSGSQMILVSADSNGVASADLIPGDYTVGLIFNDGGSYYYDTKLGALSESKTSVTIPVVPKISTANPEILYVDGVSHTAYNVSAGAVYTNLVADTINYYCFTPTESGRYKVTVAGTAAEMGYYGSPSFVLSNNVGEMEGNAFHLNVKEGNVGGTYVLGATPVDGASGCILVITREGDAILDASDLPWTIYVPSLQPESFTLNLGSGQSLVEFDITAETSEYNLVKDPDGNYHLGSQSGPLVLVQLGSKCPYVSFASMMETASPRKYFYDENGNFVKKESYAQCLTDYIDCMDSKYGVYPLNDDLIYIYKEYGESAGWYDPNGIVGSTPGANPEILWMFALCYVK